MLREMLQLPPLLDESLKSQTILLPNFAKFSSKYSGGIQPVATSSRAMIYFGAIYPKFFLFVTPMRKSIFAAHWLSNVGFWGGVWLAGCFSWVMLFLPISYPLIDVGFSIFLLLYLCFISYSLYLHFQLQTWYSQISSRYLIIKMEGWNYAKSASCLNWYIEWVDITLRIKYINQHNFSLTPFFLPTHV